MTAPISATPPQPQATPAPVGSSPFDAITPAQEQDAMENLSRMMTGTQMLQDEPGVVYALAQQKAHPADAGAIDQFLQGLDAEKQVKIAAAAGTKIMLSAQQKQLLTGLNVDYSSVEYTQQTAAQEAAAHAEAQGQTVQRDANGNPVLDAQGNIQTAKPGYKAKGIGRLFQTLHNDLVKPLNRDVVSPVGTVLSKGYNMVASLASQNNYGLNNGNYDATATAQIARNTDMQNLGYNPYNVFSTLAYQASGKAHSDLTPLADKWDAQNPGGLMGLNGDEAVAEATKFLSSPKSYRQAIENDPNLTPEQVAAKLAAVSSKQFEDFARQVGAHTASPGNDFANTLGIDPIKHSTIYALTAAATNLAAAFLVDPLLVAGKAAQVTKLGQIGIDGLGDLERPARILDPEVSTGFYAKRVQNTWQGAIDLAHQIGQASASGDKVTEAALTAKFNASMPDIAPLLPDFLGKQAIVGYTEKIVDGKKVATPILGETDGIHTLQDAATYLSSKVALTRLHNGVAARQASYMPGAISSFGLRKLKGVGAGWMTARSATRAETAYDSVVLAAHADPALAERLISDGDLIRFIPAADDAVDATTETVLAHNLEDGGMTETAVPTLKSAARNVEPDFALTPQGKGNVAFNLRKTGNPLGGSVGGWASPTAIAARTRLAAQRFTTLLPRNTLLDTEDSQTGDKIYKMAMTYMNRGDARALQAAYNAGDGGQRKAVIGGLIEQLFHASGASQSASGKAFLDAIKSRVESYSTVGDEAVLDGQNLALHAGQVRTTWLLPSFREWQRMSAKIGLHDATLGRVMTSQAADTLMTQWKMGALFKPNTVTRNQLEGWLRTALEGQLGPSLKARAMLTMPNRELWAKGHALESKAEYDALLADGKLKEARELSLSNKLGGDVLGRSAVMHKVAEAAPLALVGRAYRKLYSRAISEDELKALDEVSAGHLSEMLEGYGQQILQSDLGLRNQGRQSSEIAKAGYGPATLKRALNRAKAKGGSEKPAEGQSVSWTQADTDGTLGADRYANALALRVNKTPTVAHAVMDTLEHPETYDVNHVVAALDDPAVRQEMRLTGYGNLYWDDANGPARKALTPDEVALGKIDFANKVINDYKYLLTGQNDKYLSTLAKEIRQTSKAPDADWIAGNLRNKERPRGVLAPEVTAMPAGDINEATVAQTLQDVEGAAYQWLVERPLQRTTTSPVFWANYSKARVALNPYVDKLVAEHGISEEAAKNLAQELATRQGWVKAEQLIDDPGQKSQFDIVARNMFPFSRATQAMIRRWGGGLWQDPARARKMMLAYEGAIHSGIIYTNTYGEPTFTYPGSGVMNWLLRNSVAHIPGFEGMFRFPLASNMTGGVLMAVPGADNPLRMGMGPMISVPLREIEKLFPGEKSKFDAVDAAINGPIGVGQTFSQFMPAVVRKLYTAYDTNSRNSALASSTMGAIANLGAAGLIPKDALDSNGEARDAFIQRVKQQTHNQLYIRAVFGLFAPAAPSAPSDGTSGSKADYAFSVEGIGQLSDEYKTILNDVGGDLARANAIFTALHPDKAVWYETAHSQANASKVSLPATTAALNWMSTNAGFIGKYKSVAAYFLPPATGNEPFSDQAYKTQLELGLRQRKTPEEFYNDVRVRDAENTYYPTVDGFDAKIAAAKAAGDTASETKFTQQKSDWEKQFKELNPLFAAKLDQFGPSRATAVGQLADLHQMVADNAVPDGMAPLLSKMLREYDNYNQFVQANAGSDTVSTDRRSQALKLFNNWASQNIMGTPLQDLYQGVFRTLNTNLVNLSPTGVAK